MNPKRRAVVAASGRGKGREVICPVCGRMFTPDAANQAYCTDRCKDAAARDRDRYGSESKATD